MIPQVHIPTANFFFRLLAVPIDGNLGAGRRPFPFMVGLSPCSSRGELGRWAWVMPYFFFAFLPVGSWALGVGYALSFLFLAAFRDLPMMGWSSIVRYVFLICLLSSPVSRVQYANDFLTIAIMDENIARAS